MCIKKYTKTGKFCLWLNPSQRLEINVSHLQQSLETCCAILFHHFTELWLEFNNKNEKKSSDLDVPSLIKLQKKKKKKNRTENFKGCCKEKISIFKLNVGSSCEKKVFNIFTDVRVFVIFENKSTPDVEISLEWNEPRAVKVETLRFKTWPRRRLLYDFLSRSYSSSKYRQFFIITRETCHGILCGSFHGNIAMFCNV